MIAYLLLLHAAAGCMRVILLLSIYNNIINTLSEIGNTIINELRLHLSSSLVCYIISKNATMFSPTVSSSKTAK
jgi:hypothetical protein